ncbi:MAG: hypothetical protein ASUL_09579 [Candidatus Aramenus sulfurataquae]|uniref:Uncharacterized protein n=1 Tax=Candidatus Aramenus sulfurataquae TaxID=1326980 RepID=W7L4D8_9CREN|nr:MAG: hypothetical protein ASUL_09579 [Candidatus Aramenus sulfurataquae]
MSEQKKIFYDFLSYLREKDYEVHAIANNKYEILRKLQLGSDHFYMKFDVNAHTIDIEKFDLQFSPQAGDKIIIQFDRYESALSIDVDQLPASRKLKLWFKYPFLFADFDLEKFINKFKIMPATMIVLELLMQVPLSSSLVRDIVDEIQRVDELLIE